MFRNSEKHIIGDDVRTPLASCILTLVEEHAGITVNIVSGVVKVEEREVAVEGK
jgi:hypothetical protein